MRLNEIRKKIGRYQNRFLVKSADQSGDVKTRFRGSGLQFKEHQVYAAGDDVRFIDWKILAKTSIPFIKTFEEERSTQIHCVVDVGKSMLMGLDGVSKLQLALEFCVFLYYVAEKNRDRVYVTFVDETAKSIQAGYGETAVNRLVKALSMSGMLDQNKHIKIDSATRPILNENLMINEVKKLSTKMKNVIVLSDFLDIENVEAVLNMGSRNIHLVRISNGFELEKNIFKMPYMRGNTIRLFNRKDTNSHTENQLQSKTKLLMISPNFVDDFKEVLKRR